MEELRQTRDHAVTTDLWTEERTNTHYITVTVHYILDWKMVNRILATREMEGVKSSDRIRSTVEGILQEFGILSNDTAFVTDNGSNVVAAFKDYVRLSCAGHNINLILKYVFDHLDENNPVHSNIIKLFKDTKTLVTHFKRAGLQKALDQSLKQSVETRWNTRLAMLQSVNDALRSGRLHDILLRRNELRYLNNIDCELLEDIIQLLKPFDEATRHLSTDQTPTLHLVLPTKETLLRGLSIQDGDSVIVKELKGKLAQAVEMKFKVHLYHKVATALSPSLRSFLRKTLNGQEYEEVISTLTAFTETAETEKRVRGLVEKEDPPPEQGAMEVHNFFASCVEEEERKEDSEILLDHIFDRLRDRLEHVLEHMPLDLDFLDFICTQKLVFLNAMSCQIDVLSIILDALAHLHRLINLEKQSEKQQTIVVHMEQGPAGRQRMVISSDYLCSLLELHLPVPCIAKLLGVSRRTVYRRMAESGLSVRALYTTMSDDDLPAWASPLSRRLPGNFCWIIFLIGSVIVWSMFLN
ncbi:unnamed protein product, partial [Menidia menidia]